VLLDYYRRHYGPENAVLIVVGCVVPEQLFERADIHFTALRNSGRPDSPATPSLPVSGPHKVVVRGPMLTEQVRLMVGARTVGRTHADRWALVVLAEFLAEELIQEIRYRRGLVYGLSAYNRVFNDAGYFGIHTMSERDKQRDILDVVKAQLEDVERGKVDTGRVAEAQTALKGRWALAMEDNLERARWLAEWCTVLRDSELPPKYAGAIDAVAPADLSRMVTTYLTPERRYLGLHQPVVTVTSGARKATLATGLGLGAWAARRMWRWTRARRKDGAK
jgi:predicted Zn-dependent peptidase